MRMRNRQTEHESNNNQNDVDDLVNINKQRNVGVVKDEDEKKTTLNWRAKFINTLKKSRTFTVIAILLIFGICCFYFYWMKEDLNCDEGLPVPRNFDDCKLVHSLKRGEQMQALLGGFRRLFKSKYEIENQQQIDVLIKVIREPTCGLSKGHFREAHVRSLIDHPFILPVLMSCNINQSNPKWELTIVEEYYREGSLKNALLNNLKFRKRIHTNLTFRYTLLKQLASALEYLHSGAIFDPYLNSNVVVVHDDLNWFQVLLSNDGEKLMLTDFNQAKRVPVRSAAIPRVERNNSKILRRGWWHVARFFAPEKLRYEYYGESVDIYSFGIIWYEMLLEDSQILPSAANEFWTAMTDERYKELILDKPNGLRPSKPLEARAEEWDLISACWNYDPDLRPSAFQIRKTLEKWLDRISKKGEISMQVTPDPTAKPKNPWLYLGGWRVDD